MFLVVIKMATNHPLKLAKFKGVTFDEAPSSFLSTLPTVLVTPLTKLETLIFYSAFQSTDLAIHTESVTGGMVLKK